MAQIKNIKKPGDLIRGAKVGVAGLDKDGNVIGTGIDTEDIATFPEGAQSGDVLTWGGETGPEWRPHYPESGSEGDVLTLGETGPEWTPADTALYEHNIMVYWFAAGEYPQYNVMFKLITKSATPMTSNDQLLALLPNDMTSYIDVCGTLIPSNGVNAVVTWGRMTSPAGYAWFEGLTSNGTILEVKINLAASSIRDYVRTI